MRVCINCKCWELDEGIGDWVIKPTFRNSKLSAVKCEQNPPHPTSIYGMSPQILLILSNGNRSIYSGEEGGFCSIFLEFI
jgi:hypothetical protein